MQRDSLKIIKNILDIDQMLTHEEYLKEFVKRIAQELKVKYVFLGHPVNHQLLLSVQTDIVWANGEFVDNFLYHLKDTPCEIVLSGKRVCIHEQKVCQIFPNDILLQEMGIESYIGAPVISHETKQVESLLVLLDDKPMEDKDFFIAITDFLALRAAAEIDKYKIEDKLKHEVALRTQELQEANDEIEEINKNLLQRVEEEVLKNEKKKRIIVEQSKMAIMGEMIESIAHQWKQPLSTIKMSSSGVSLTKEIGKLTDEKLLQSMEDISQSVDFLSQTINDFKDFFKVNKQQNEFYLNQVIDKTVKLLSSRLKILEILVRNDSDNIKFFGLQNELIQVFLNLFSNSIDEFERNKHNNNLIHINAVEYDEKLVLTFHDNAGGIKEELLSKIFKPYVSSKKESGGTGIGLYMSHEIITKHMKGTITVENKNIEFNNCTYNGALFTITLFK